MTSRSATTVVSLAPAPYLKRLGQALDDHVGGILFVDEHGHSCRYDDALALAETPAIVGTRRRLVFCLCGNTHYALLGYLALLRADAVQVMLDPAITADHLRRLAELYRPDFYWLPAARGHEVENATSCLGLGDYLLLADSSRADGDIHPDLSLLLSTSGTTGSPKLVRLSHDNLRSNAESIAGYLDIDADERPITSLPPSYSYGLSVIHSHILVGAHIIVSDRSVMQPAFWDFLNASHATSFAGVPYHYELLRKLRFHERAPSVRTFTQAGGHMNRELTIEVARFCQDRGMRLYCMYGQTEATARMAFLAPEKTIEKAGSIGQAIPGGQLSLQDDAGNLIASDDTVGELVYRGRNVFLGYAESRADLARADDQGGILRTGDMARRDADGDHTIVGRLRRMLKMFGARINLHEVELALGREGYRVACAGQDDALNIYVCTSSVEAARAIKSFAVHQLHVPPSSVSVHSVDAFPLSPQGKIAYPLLADACRERLA